MYLRHFIDVAERFILLAGGISFWLYFSVAALAHPQYWLLVIETGILTLIVAVRPFGGDIALKPYPIAISILATNLLFWVRPDGYNPGAATVGGILMFIGLVFSVSGKVALNRRFGIVPANRGVQVKGPYALVRHPIYAGYFISHFGFLITNPTLWNLSLYSAAVVCQILRISEEEKILGRDPVYQAYRERVRFRLVPGLY